MGLELSKKENKTFLGGHRVPLFFLELVVHFIDINSMDLSPSIFGHMEQVVDSSRSSVTESGMVDGSFPQINGFLYGQIRAVSSVQDTVSYIMVRRLLVL